MIVYIVLGPAKLTYISIYIMKLNTKSTPKSSFMYVVCVIGPLMYWFIANTFFVTCYGILGVIAREIALHTMLCCKARSL